MNLRSRLYKSENDYHRMRRLIMEDYLHPDVTLSLWTVGDLDYHRFACEDDAASMGHSRLWEDDSGRLLGFAWPRRTSLEMTSHHSCRDLEEEILSWSESWMEGRGLEPLAVQAGVEDHKRQSLLREHGYNENGTRIYRGRRDLTVPVPQASLPEGYTLRSLLWAQDSKPRAQLCEFALGGTPVTPERYLRLMQRAPGYRTDLDLVGLDPEGEMVAFATFWFDDENRVGKVEPVGCHPEHRLRGLCKNLLWEGMRRLRAMGARELVVSTPRGEIPGVLALLDSAGFEAMGENGTWVRGAA